MCDIDIFKYFVQFVMVDFGLQVSVLKIHKSLNTIRRIMEETDTWSQLSQ